MPREFAVNQPVYIFAEGFLPQSPATGENLYTPEIPFPGIGKVAATLGIFDSVNPSIPHNLITLTPEHRVVPLPKTRQLEITIAPDDTVPNAEGDIGALRCKLFTGADTLVARPEGIRPETHDVVTFGNWTVSPKVYGLLTFPDAPRKKLLEIVKQFTVTFIPASR